MLKKWVPSPVPSQDLKSDDLGPSLTDPVTQGRPLDLRALLPAAEWGGWAFSRHRAAVALGDGARVKAPG